MISKAVIKLLLAGVFLVASAVFITLFLQHGWYLLALLLLLIGGLAIGTTISTYTSTVKKVTFMFNSIENDDFTFRFTGSSKVNNDRLLNQSLNRIKDLVLAARINAREREKYFEIILSQVNTGIVVLNAQGVVFQVNGKALRLIGLPHLSHVNQLYAVAAEMSADFLNIQDGESRTVKFYDEASEVSLNITATTVDVSGKALKVVALTDIAEDLDEAKMESWQRLSRVLTHEIMNSLAPITSLSETLLTTTDQNILHCGLDIIHSTSSGLIKFVDNYRTLTRLPQPILEETDMERLVRNEVGLLTQNTDCPRLIEIEVLTQEAIVMADHGQISQVLINLLKNAVEAVPAQERVWVNIAKNTRGRVYVEVCNTGPLIPDEVRDNIFVPFFTTKDSGNGIGLSLSRQIMRIHDGTLTLATRPYTKFRMQF